MREERRRERTRMWSCGVGKLLGEMEDSDEVDSESESEIIQSCGILKLFMKAHARLHRAARSLSKYLSRPGREDIYCANGLWYLPVPESQARLVQKGDSSGPCPME
jgi:hypothetical protein